MLDTVKTAFISTFSFCTNITISQINNSGNNIGSFHPKDVLNVIIIDLMKCPKEDFSELK